MQAFHRAALALAFAAVAAGASAENLRLHSTNAMQGAMEAILPAFEKATGHRVQATFEPTNAILERLKKGEGSDVVFLIKGSLQPLKQSGFVRAESEKDLASVSMGIAVRPGTPAPDLGSVDAFKRFLIATPSIVLSRAGASGIEFNKALERNGLGDLKSRVVHVEGATRTADIVARGEGALAVQMLSELKPVNGVVIMAPLPGDFHFQITVSSALTAQAPAGASAAAADLVRFVGTKEAKELLQLAGMEPL